MDNLDLPFSSYTHYKKSYYFEGYLYYLLHNHRLYIWTSNKGWVKISIAALEHLTVR